MNIIQLAILRLAYKPVIDWNKRLPSFIASTTAEINSIHDMATYDSNEVLDEAQMEISKIGMSKIVFTKKYRPDGSFDKYKICIVFRGD